jgi:hypothetical protein
MERRFPEPNLFHISKEQGASVLNVFFGIGEMYDNLNDYIEILDDRLPEGFIPIGDDPAGNVICLGIKNPYYEKIYFWDHEQEPDNPNSAPFSKNFYHCLLVEGQLELQTVPFGTS